jgi:hypothetical protein
VLVDLGWYPSHRPKGSFRLVAVQLYEQGERMSASWEKPLRELRTRSKRKVVATLEEWLDWYSNREPASEFRRRNRARRR